MCTCENNSVKKSTALIDPSVYMQSMSRPPENNQSVAKTGWIEPSPFFATGRIIDEFGEPLGSATVHVTDDKTRFSIVDLDGNFAVPNVTFDDLLEIRHAGKKTILVNPEENLGNIVLEDSLEELDAVVVTAHRSKSFPWMQLAIGVTTVVAGGLIINEITKNQPVKAAV